MRQYQADIVFTSIGNNHIHLFCELFAECAPEILFSYPGIASFIHSKHNELNFDISLIQIARTNCRVPVRPQ